MNIVLRRDLCGHQRSNAKKAHFFISYNWEVYCLIGFLVKRLFWDKKRQVYIRKRHLLLHLQASIHRTEFDVGKILIGRKPMTPDGIYLRHLS